MAGVGLWRGNFRCRGETREFLHNTPRPVLALVRLAWCAPPGRVRESSVREREGEPGVHAGAAGRWPYPRAT
jgi:hypothetical protein